MTLPDLHSIPISDLISYRRNAQEFRSLINVHEDVPLSSVLQTLHDHGILSVPVCRAAPDGGKEFTGIISVFDVMAWTVFQGMFDDTA